MADGGVHGDGGSPESPVLLRVHAAHVMARRAGQAAAAASGAVQHAGEGATELGGHEAVDDGVAGAVDVDEQADELHDVQVGFQGHIVLPAR